MQVIKYQVLSFLMLCSLYAQGQSNCSYEYAITISYDPVIETICINYRGVDYEQSRFNIHIVDERGQPTEIKENIRQIITKAEYDEILSYYTDYRAAIKGANTDVYNEETAIYQSLVNQVLNEG